MNEKPNLGAGSDPRPDQRLALLFRVVGSLSYILAAGIVVVEQLPSSITTSLGLSTQDIGDRTIYPLLGALLTATITYVAYVVLGSPYPNLSRLGQAVVVLLTLSVYSMLLVTMFLLMGNYSLPVLLPIDLIPVAIAVVLVRTRRSVLGSQYWNKGGSGHRS